MYSPRPFQNTVKNVNMLERWFSMIAGGALTTWGLRRGGMPGLMLTLIGGYLAQRGLTGHCAIYEAAGLSTAPDSVTSYGGAQSSKSGSTRVGTTPGSAEGDREIIEADLRAKYLQT